MNKVLIGIPTYNEKLNIASLVLEIFSLYPSINVFVIDDNSPDGTEIILQTLKKKFENFNYLIRSEKAGVGSAHIAALNYAYENNFNYLITLDADYTHQPKYIKEFLKERKNCEIVLGSRFTDSNGVSDWILYRRLMTHWGHYLTKFFLGMKQDASGAFRCYNLTLIKKDIFKYITNKSYGFFVESLYLFCKCRFKIKEVPIILPKRTYGESKMTFKDVKNTLLLIFRIRYKKYDNKIILDNTPRIDNRKQFYDPQNWDSYWKKQSNSISRLYQIIAYIYRNTFIVSRINTYIDKYFEGKSNLLHCGCGSGHIDTKISKRHSLHAIDISEEAVLNYRHNVPDVMDVSQRCIFNTNYPNNKFDGIYNLGVMEHFKNEEIIQIFFEMKRILKINGRIILFWPHRFSSSVIFLKCIKYLFCLFNKNISFHPAEISLVKNRKMIESLAQKTGFILESYDFSIRDLFVQTVICLKNSKKN